jgi:hypothetical protein
MAVTGITGDEFPETKGGGWYGSARRAPWPGRRLAAPEQAPRYAILKRP